MIRHLRMHSLPSLYFGLDNCRMLRKSAFTSISVNTKFLSKRFYYVSSYDNLKITVKDPRYFSFTLLRLVEDSNIEKNLYLLQSLRENPSLRPAVLAQLRHKYQASLSENNDGIIAIPRELSSDWFDVWLMAALNESTISLLPFSVECHSMSEVESILAEIFKELVQSKYGHRPVDFLQYIQYDAFYSDDMSIDANGVKRKDLHIAASIAFSLKQYFNYSKLGYVKDAITDYSNKSINGDELLARLSMKCSLHIDLLQPLLQYLSIPISPVLRKILLSRKSRRDWLIEKIKSEISHLVYIHSAKSEDLSADSNDASKNDPLSDTETSPGRIYNTKTMPSTSDEVQNEVQRQRLHKTVFGVTHVFEITVQCFSPSSKHRLSKAFNENLHFENYFKSLSSSRTLSPTLYPSMTEAQKIVTDKVVDDYHDLLSRVKMDEFAMSNSSKLAEIVEKRNEEEEMKWKMANQSISSPVDVMEMGFEPSSTHRKIMLNNLPDSATEETIANALRYCGPVSKIWLFKGSDRVPIDSIMTTKMTIPSPPIEFPDELFTFTPYATEKDSTEKVPVSIATYKSNDLTATKKKKNRSFPKRGAVLKTNKTDNYAFIIMSDDEGYKNITKDVVRLFGICIDGRACLSLPAEKCRNFRVEVKDGIQVKEVLHALNLTLEGHFDCFLVKDYPQTIKPLFLELKFNSHEEAWQAYQTIIQSSKHDFVFLNPCWIRSSWFWDMAGRARIVLENGKAENDLLSSLLKQNVRLRKLEAESAKTNKSKKSVENEDEIV